MSNYSCTNINVMLSALLLLAYTNNLYPFDNYIDVDDDDDELLNSLLSRVLNLFSDNN